MSKLEQLRAQREAWAEGRPKPTFGGVDKQLAKDLAKVFEAKPVWAVESNKSNSVSNSEAFDKKAYQREYMRKRRAKKP